MPAYRLSALTIAPAARDWLGSSHTARFLHVFDHVCNLINGYGEVFSIVSEDIGDGPFNLVLEDEPIIFSDYLDIQSQITIDPNRIILGNVRINAQNAQLWSPRPDWETLHAHKEDILNQLMSLPMSNYQPLIPHSLLSALFTSIAAADIPFSLTAARGLAGLGAGLTPAGDDLMLGALLAARIIHPSEIARVIAEEITNTAAPLTTSLSAAWLKSAGKGDAGILWHKFFAALISADKMAVQDSVDKISAVGHTSGADALAGFLGSFMGWEEFCSKPARESGAILFQLN